jgi:hypothetical protein
VSAAGGLSGPFWPNSAQEQLLRVAFAPDDEVVERWRTLAGLRIETLEHGTLGLLPVVLARLVAAGVEDDRMPRLQGTQRNVWYRNQLQLHRLPQLVAALEGDNIEPLALGAAPLAALYYEQPALRPIVQLELAVDPDAGPAARRAIEKLGWRRIGGRDRGFALYQAEEGAARAFLSEGAPPFVAGPFTPRIALAQLRARASRRDLAGTTALVLDPVDELVVACALGARRIVPQSPQWLVDTQRILTSAAPDAESLADRAAQFRLVPAVRDTLVYLARVSEEGELDRYVTALSTRAVSSRDRYVHALAGAGNGRFGAPPTALVLHARTTVGTPLLRALMTLPRAFQAAWEVGDRRRLPAVALRKALRRLGQSRNVSASS